MLGVYGARLFRCFSLGITHVIHGHYLPCLFHQIARNYASKPIVYEARQAYFRASL